VAVFTNGPAIPVTDVTSQLLGQAGVLAPRIFHVNGHSLAARVLYLKRHAIEQGLAPRVFHLNLHATEQALAARVIHLNRRDLASRVFHLNHPVIGQSLTTQTGLRSVRDSGCPILHTPYDRPRDSETPKNSAPVHELSGCSRALGSYGGSYWSV
jgi:hypothetical protein